MDGLALFQQKHWLYLNDLLFPFPSGHFCTTSAQQSESLVLQGEMFLFMNDSMMM